MRAADLKRLSQVPGPEQTTVLGGAGKHLTPIGKSDVTARRVLRTVFCTEAFDFDHVALPSLFYSAADFPSHNGAGGDRSLEVLAITEKRSMNWNVIANWI